MASSHNSGSASRGSSIRYRNMNCQCRLVSDIKVSQSHQNPGRLYYSCQNNKCKWVGWCEPVEDDDDGKKTAETNCTHGETRMAKLEDEFKNLDNLVDGMKEGIQEEFATIKFEVNNAIVDVKREVDVKLSILKRDFEKELIALTTELNEMKKPNWILKYGIIGCMFAMVIVFINNRL
ncbi:hypothetical protein QL285_071304 [Trifolium repens]|nr:hypothetical protein QL285_071304 [Trifolium repens]